MQKCEASDHQLVEVLGVGEFGDGRLRHIAAPEHLVDIHLGHAAGRGARVVVMRRIDDHAVEHPLHLFLDFVEQLLEFTGFDEFGDVVVGMKALLRLLQPLADLDRDGGSLGFAVFFHVDEFSEHAWHGNSEPCPLHARDFAIKRRIGPRRMLHNQ
jgi:hypothetical protein